MSGLKLYSFSPDSTATARVPRSRSPPDGRSVHCSNRGHDGVVTYAANPQNGALDAIGWTPTGGKVPRFIGLSPNGRHLYAASEQGDTIVPFRVDARSGRLTPGGRAIACKSPACIVYAGGAALPVA